MPDDTVADGEIHQHQVAGPGALPLEMIERMVILPNDPNSRCVWIVAADARLLTEPVDRFNGLLIWSLGMLGLGLVVAAVVQVVVGLRPLGDLRRALVEVRRPGPKYRRCVPTGGSAAGLRLQRSIGA